ncbi:MAG TPA: NEW3 domain-containing protein [Gemmatimonadaceae bacterium]
MKAVVAAGSPRSYQVVSIPVPAEVPRTRDAVVEIVPQGAFVVLGSRVRFLSAMEGRPTFTITIGIPAAALAGRAAAAQARFSVAGVTRVVVPIEIDVIAVRDLMVSTPPGPLRARAGDRVIVRYDLMNGGNVAEAVDVSLVAPSKWAGKELSNRRMAVAPGHTLPQQTTIAIPQAAGTGSFFVRLQLLEKGVVRREVPVRVEVLEALTGGPRAGPEIVTSVTRAMDRTGRAASIVAARVQGPLFDSVRVDARFSRLTSGGSELTPSLARLGAYETTPSVVLTAPSGWLAVGATGTSFSDLTGLYMYGRGAAFEVKGRRWGVMALGATSLRTSDAAASQPLLGVRGEVAVGRAKVLSSVSRLREGGTFRRELSAASIGVTVPAGGSATIHGEIAHRQHLAGSGTGWAAELARDDHGNTSLLRVVHAPGGSNAFARATDEVTASVTQKLTGRMSVSASGWQLEDATETFAGIKTDGWSIRPQYTLPFATLALEARASSFDAQQASTAASGASGFGRDERAIGVNVNSFRRGYYFSGSSYVGSEARTVSTADHSGAQPRSPKVTSSLIAGYSSLVGRIEIDARIDQTRDAGGFVRDQRSAGVRGERLIAGSAANGPRFDWDVRRVTGISTRSVVTARGGLTISLPGAVNVRFSVERDPFLRGFGRNPLVFGVRFEQSMRAPMLRRPATSGYVYRDLNGNRRRDPSEPGVRGVVIRRGGENVSTDGRGKYRVAGDLRDRIEVDDASVPSGWTPFISNSGDIGLTATTSAEIRFLVAARSGIAGVSVDLSRARVVARDKSGREWAARMTGPFTATFDGLPAGTYKLELDFSGLAEPLVPRGPLPALPIVPGEHPIIPVTLDPRPLRIWRADETASSPRN